MEQNFESDENVVSQTTEQTTEHENAQQTVMAKPNNNMFLAILTTVCCCCPLGIVAIIKASQVNNLFAMKQYEAAQINADEAKKWSYIGMALGFLFWIIYVIAFSPLMRLMKSSL